MENDEFEHMKYWMEFGIMLCVLIENLILDT